ncbi:DNA (cytosine-5-)-methyltransferase [Streptomyces sp. 549]|uniref:DNA cytosine methyltransferase n=1 Tax=Streptomyces sp. 549 TaxID=3049076 RepID=UPI0024C46E6D|nr:DNA (cytosine-5-)-methyltransferase [Streptomyces sp. 549]MDK1473281.1 DNA (cytosine-5-)-methyltransferase [Streptomyces sp. 549]
MSAGGHLRVLSLFSGIGGLELGLERAGLRVVGQVESNKFCRRVLAHHWPEVDRHDDVRTAAAWWDSRPRPLVDVVCGGYPCQPFSLAGHQLGTADERWLWPAMADVVRHVRPRYVLVENVADLVRDADAFGWMLGDLAALGFDAQWAVLSAPDFGAPQAARERLYLLAHPPSLHGSPRHRMGQGAERETPLTTGGLPRPPVAARRQTAHTWLAAEPHVDRLAHGLPHHVDQLAAYGNAVIPTAAEHLGRLITTDHHHRTQPPT